MPNGTKTSPSNSLSKYKPLRIQQLIILLQLRKKLAAAHGELVESESVLKELQDHQNDPRYLIKQLAANSHRLNFHDYSEDLCDLLYTSIKHVTDEQQETCNDCGVANKFNALNDAIDTSISEIEDLGLDCSSEPVVSNNGEFAEEKRLDQFNRIHDVRAAIHWIG